VCPLLPDAPRWERKENIVHLLFLSQEEAVGQFEMWQMLRTDKPR
jgi:hypothetical protein